MDIGQAERRLCGYVSLAAQHYNGMADATVYSNNFHFLRSVLSQNIPGDVVELGCHAGRTSALLALTLQIMESDKLLYLFDSFEGLSQPSQEDIADKNGSRNFGDYAVEMSACVEQVKEIAPGQMFSVIPGWVEDTIPELLPDQIAYAYLDLNLYEPTRHAFRHVYERMPPSGVVLFDDWHNPGLPGVQRAVNEVLDVLPERPRLLPVPGQAYMVKE